MQVFNYLDESDLTMSELVWFVRTSLNLIECE